MAEIVWYSRLAVLVGAAILLIQSVLGRAVGLLTFLAILLLCVGFVVFCISLALSEVDIRRLAPAVVGEGVEAAVPEVEVAPEEPEPAVMPVPPVESQESEPVPEPSVPAARSVSAPAARIPVTEVAEGSPLVDQACPSCGQAIQVGDAVAVCPVCEVPNHAACWIEHHFHCGTPGCAGRGSLDAPEE